MQALNFQSLDLNSKNTSSDKLQHPEALQEGGEENYMYCYCYIQPVAWLNMTTN